MGEGKTETKGVTVRYHPGLEFGIAVHETYVCLSVPLPNLTFAAENTAVEIANRLHGALVRRQGESVLQVFDKLTFSDDRLPVAEIKWNEWWRYKAYQLKEESSEKTVTNACEDYRPCTMTFAEIFRECANEGAEEVGLDALAYFVEPVVIENDDAEVVVAELDEAAAWEENDPGVAEYSVEFASRLAQGIRRICLSPTWESVGKAASEFLWAFGVGADTSEVEIKGVNVTHGERIAIRFGVGGAPNKMQDATFELSATLDEDFVTAELTVKGDGDDCHRLFMMDFPLNAASPLRGSPKGTHPLEAGKSQGNDSVGSQEKNWQCRGKVWR